MVKLSRKKIIDDSDWDDLVTETYKRPYKFQQQDDCQDRGLIEIIISTKDTDNEEEEMNDSVPEVVNGEEMGVKFKAWLERDPKQPIPGQTADYELELFWERNFYPNLQTVANDLCRKGLIKPGTYSINIDW